MRSRTTLPSRATNSVARLINEAKTRLRSMDTDIDIWRQRIDTRHNELLGRPLPFQRSDPKADKEEKERLEAGVAEAKAELENWYTRQRHLRTFVEAVEDGSKSALGLAPWDRECLLLRRVLDGDESPTLPSILIKGPEAVELCKQTLRISRSSYYALVRPLLRTYQLNPTQYYSVDGYLYRQPGAHVRFDRTELEHLVAAIEARTVWY